MKKNQQIQQIVNIYHLKRHYQWLRSIYCVWTYTPLVKLETIAYLRCAESATLSCNYNISRPEMRLLWLESFTLTRLEESFTLTRVLHLLWLGLFIYSWLAIKKRHSSKVIVAGSESRQVSVKWFESSQVEWCLNFTR